MQYTAVYYESYIRTIHIHNSSDTTVIIQFVQKYIMINSIKSF